jgi:hypothetical protein
MPDHARTHANAAVTAATLTWICGVAGGRARMSRPIHAQRKVVAETGLLVIASLVARRLPITATVTLARRQRGGLWALVSNSATNRRGPGPNSPRTQHQRSAGRQVSPWRRSTSGRGTLSDSPRRVEHTPMKTRSVTETMARLVIAAAPSEERTRMDTHVSTYLRS